MNAFFTFLAICVALAIANAPTITFGIVLLILFLLSAVTQPRLTFWFLAALGLLGLVSAKPVARVVAATAIVVALVVSERRRKPTTPLLLTDQR